MARIRTIKPDFFRHLTLYKLEIETSLPLRVAYSGLWTACDREGRFKWEAEILKLDCLPFDNVEFSRVLDTLWTRGFIEKYQVEGREYGYIPSWHDHQIINNRESESKLPEPNDFNILTREGRVLHVIQGEGKGKEGKGRERKGKEHIVELHEEIIKDLNEVLKTNYRSTTKDIQKLLQARLADNYTLDDFKAVHRNMFQAWSKDPKMRDFLRPHTLYTEKFQSYLNKRPPTLSQQGIVSEKTEKNIEVLNNWLANEEAKDREAENVN